MRINRSALLGALNIGARVVPTKTTISVLRSALVQPVEGGVLLHTTNQEMGLSQRLDADDVPRKPFLAPVARLAAILKTCSDELVTITPERSLVIEADGARWSLPQVEKTQEFPALAKPEGDARPVSIARSALAQLLARVEPMVCRDETRSNLSGVYFEGDGTRLTLVATDGHRLSTGTVECGLKLTALVALSHIHVVQQLLDDATADEIALHHDGKLLAVEVGGALLSCRLVEADFPDYRQVIPARPAARVVVDTEAMRSALTKLQPLERKRGGMFTVDGDAVTIEASSEDGEVVVRVPADIEGPAAKIGISVPYAISAFAGVRGEKAVLGVTDEVSPVTVRSHDQSDTWLSVVMPMRL